jgi:hypothetical protein
LEGMYSLKCIRWSDSLKSSEKHFGAVETQSVHAERFDNVLKLFFDPNFNTEFKFFDRKEKNAYYDVILTI